MELGSVFFTNSENLFSKDELESVLTKDSTFFIEYAETMWLDKYFKMKALSNTTSIPSINSTISETPSAPSNEFNSKTENYALKSVLANEWVVSFHRKLNLLPETYRKLIELRYLERDFDGKHYDGNYIAEKLNISRAGYYNMRKKALEELGRLLYPTGSE